MKKILLVFFVLSLAPAAQALLIGQYLKTAWSEDDEIEFSNFVQALGESNCNTLSRCIHSSANKYYNPLEDESLWPYADCADLPYELRAYFAWKKGLPFSFVNDLEPIGTATPDERYSPRGNRPMDRYQNFKPRDAEEFFKMIANTVHTGNMRVPANLMYYSSRPKIFSDFYSVAVTRDAIVPGTIIYDPAGHIGVVYRVGGDGSIYYMDAHPDNSLTRGRFGEKFVRSSLGVAAGFKRFRSTYIANPKYDASGIIVGGEMYALKNAQHPQFSLEQFLGTEPNPDGWWKDAVFKFKGQTLPFHDFVKARMIEGDYKINPLLELRLMMQGICTDLKDRVTSVNAATKAGTDFMPQPDRLPDNIYGSTGLWEDYATPSRDARLKVSYREALTQTQKFVARYEAQDPSIDYSGSNLLQDLLNVYRSEAKLCSLAYTDSVGREKKLSYESVRQRLFALSFDPYHCPELRWGASTKEELSSCPTDELKFRWYAAEQRLRNQLERTYDNKMNFSVEELENNVNGSGVNDAPDVDLSAWLEAQLPPQ